MAALVPAAGILFLDPNAYAVWALAATLTTIFLLVDFGTTGLATKLAAEARIGGRPLITLFALTAVPPILLTVITLVAWPAYSAAAKLTDARDPAVLLLITLVGVGTTLRSLGLISAAVALGRNDFRKRSAILLAGALTQAAVTVAMLASGVGILSLGFGVVTGGLVQLAFGIILERPDRESASTEPVWPLVRRFASSRGAAVLFGVAITQLDRWSLGLFASAAVVTVYDIAIRFATMPKIALLAFGGGLVTEASGEPPAHHLLKVFRTYTKMYAVLAGVAILPVVFVAVLIGTTRTNLPLLVILPIAVLTAMAHAVNATTIPASFLGMGLGRPGLELLYLTPLVACCALSYVIGNLTQLPLGQVGIWAGAMFACSVIYVVAFPRLNGWRRVNA
ncbi:hypothetical protein BIU98_14885 [Curtobacterium sp. MMLR14_010]|nr:hypothetical protein BIU98_14885 [Curtobacterium sp. MMLR14_010]